MAGNIQNLNLSQFNAKCEEYTEKVRSIGENCNELYMGMIGFGSCWKGQRINAVYEKYNEVRLRFYDFFQFCSNQVYSVLNEIYGQYMAMENEGKAEDLGPISANFPSSYYNLSYEVRDYTPGDKIVFLQEEVVKQVDKVKVSLDNMVNQIPALVDMLDDIAGWSDSLNTLSQNYHARAEALTSAVKEARDTLVAQFEQEMKTVQETEGYNENDAGRIQQSTEE